MTRYLVTGGAGFIGSHLVDALVHAGHEVRVLDDLSTGRLDNLNESRDGIEFLVGSVRDVDLVTRMAAGVRGIFHLAAIGSVPRSFADPAATFATNVAGTGSVIAAARAAGVRRMVLASSSSVYGAAGGRLRRETDATAPLSPYAESKLAAERICLTGGSEDGLEVVCLRYFNVYGPRQDPSSRYAAAIPRFISCFLRGAHPEIYGDGEQTRDFTYVGDVVEGTLAAMFCPRAANLVVNLGTGRSTSVNRLVALVRETMGCDLEVDHQPPRAGEVRRSVADITLARSLLGYEPAWALVDGLRATIQWHRHRARLEVAR